jgi:hypothetical protein
LAGGGVAVDCAKAAPESKNENMIAATKERISASDEDFFFISESGDSLYQLACETKVLGKLHSMKVRCTFCVVRETRNELFYGDALDAKAYFVGSRSNDRDPRIDICGR